ncbi:ammonium transporter [Flavobacterium sp.]|uniref:ammonium transporter n=1 Tax=Flavobacterium sp. TaxID=239 RepID=UPI00286E02FB|nr:ammonium transporter [Flavobacterium sp.]
MKKILLSVILLTIMLLPIFSNLVFTESPLPIGVTNFDTGDIAWMLVATALVLLMTPGLAFFYGGLVGKKNVISTMFQSFIAMVIVTVLWIVVGYGLCYGPSIQGFIGNPLSHLFFQGIDSNTTISLAPSIPLVLFAMYQAKFAIITPALITGSFAERIRFWPYILFIVLFILFIYAPIAHTVWHPDGFFHKMGVLDFAGGTVVHMSAGWAALAGAIFLGRRKIQTVNPAQVPYVLLGTGLLWVGWFGFNAGSAMGANGIAAQALGVTAASAAAGGMAWMFLDKIRGYEITAVETCLGVLVGLIAATPAAGYVSIYHAVSIGCIASIVSYIVVSEFPKGIIDDALDVFACHGVAGITGMLLTGVFATKAVNPSLIDQEGLLYNGTTLFTNQLIAVGCISVFAFVGSYLLFIIVNLVSKLRVSEELEQSGLDSEQIGGVI